MGVTVEASTDTREGAIGFGHRDHLVTPMGEGVVSEERQGWLSEEAERELWVLSQSLARTVTYLSSKESNDGTKESTSNQPCSKVE